MAALPKKIRQDIADAIEELEENPRPHGYEKLKAKKTPTYRIRVGSYRVIYEINDRVLTVIVLQIGDRKEIYR